MLFTATAAGCDAETCQLARTAIFAQALLPKRAFLLRVCSDVTRLHLARLELVWLNIESQAVAHLRNCSINDVADMTKDLCPIKHDDKSKAL